MFFATTTSGQDTTTIARGDLLAVIARPGIDSTTLRWAPLTVDSWKMANQYGYTIERFTLVRNGKVVQPLERKILTSIPLKPLPEEQWERFINNKYGMIAAQALYGETFELNVEQSDVTQIVNKANEIEQRFSIALFCADMSPAIARAQGLYWSDKQIEKNVKYLYRITVITATDTIRGSAFVDTSLKYQLPPLSSLTGEASGNAVTLRWNQLEFASHYTTYRVERSEDGSTFIPISDLPGVALSKKTADSKYQYAVDTVASLEKEYSYRVRGLTPFGEQGPASNTVKVKGHKVVTSTLFITTALSADNKTVDVQWVFPEAENDALAGFEVTRAPTSSGPYKTLHKELLPSTVRTFKDTTPQHTNYYKIKGKTPDGAEISSMPYLALLVDSLPPMVPTALKGRVDDYGKVSLSWRPNPDSDIFGYRVYRAYYKSEEFSLMTGEPVADTTFRDQVELKTLNEKVHYRVMAIDKNQNHSELSEVLSLSLPDKIPPMPAVWLPAKSTKDGVELSWQMSSSIDVVRYDVYRKGDAGQWMRLASKDATKDTLYTYTDQNLRTTDSQYYTLTAVDDAGLESPPTPVISALRLPQPKPPVAVDPPAIDRNLRKVVVSWRYTEAGVVAYRIYKRKNDGAPVLYRTVKELHFTDEGFASGDRCRYQVMAVFSNGSFSEMGKVISINF
jgi:fibronectin type 3 domain-containing protein